MKSKKTSDKLAVKKLEKNIMKILDCTIRDGGYYTNWDFEDSLVKTYAESMEKLPIDYIEVGYRSTPQNEYLGQYYYCPEYVLKNLKSLMPSKELVIILNEKDIRVSDIDEGLLDPCKLYVSLVRLAIDPKNMKRAILLAKAVKNAGFKVAFNVMYMSNWKNDSSFLDDLEGLDDIVEYFYMVDSYGGVLPEDVKETIELIRSKTNVPLGFHGHDNLEMALINTITAIEAGCDIIDATITGMGRGAGNLKTELLLTYLENAKGLSVAFSELSNVVSDFEELRKQYNWGTSLPYMFSGAKSLPQKQVMEWVGLNRYPLGTIINALNNQKDKVKDNCKLPVLSKTNSYEVSVILGAGKTSKAHKSAIKKFIELSEGKTSLIHAGARNIGEYLDVKCDQYYGLVGFENENLLSRVGDNKKIKQICMYPPYPRPMGTNIPERIKDFSKEIDSISFTSVTSDSPLALAIQTGLDLGAKEIYLVGFDGYDVNINQNQFVIANENQKVIDAAVSIEGVVVKTFTPTKYENIDIISLYSLL